MSRVQAGKVIEFLIVHTLIVVSVLVMSWGPLVYLMRTVAMHKGVAA